MSDFSRVERRQKEGERYERDDPDHAAVRSVLAGDVDAFAGIVSRWQSRLFNLAWRFCRDRATAEDMAQEAFVKAFRSLRTFRGDAAFSTWLTAIALNSYRTFLRDRPPLPTAIDLAVRAGPDALTVIEHEERDAVVRRVLLTLPHRYREPLILFYLEEMNLTETANTLGLREGTLKARLHRGRALLRRRLAALSAAND